MRFIILFSLVLTSLNVFADVNDTTPKRSNGLLRFLAREQGLRNLAIYSVISNRCQRYMSDADKLPCKDAVAKMVGLLDMDIIINDDKGHDEDTWTPRSFVFVAFKKNFTTLLNLPKTSLFLKDLNEKIYQYWTGERASLSIWDLALSHYQSPYTASLVLATLFQDTSKMKLHLAWLETARVQGNNNFVANKELLHRVIDTINLILDTSEDNFRELFYPANVQKDLNRNIYHFYVPMYLSMSLEKIGVGKDFAYVAPLFLNLSYEFVTQAKDYRYLYTDPDVITNDHTLKDIYGGYCGTNFAVRGDNYTKNFELMKLMFQRSSDEGVQFLLRH